MYYVYYLHTYDDKYRYIGMTKQFPHNRFNDHLIGGDWSSIGGLLEEYPRSTWRMTVLGHFIDKRDAISFEISMTRLYDTVNNGLNKQYGVIPTHEAVMMGNAAAWRNGKLLIERQTRYNDPEVLARHTEVMGSEQCRQRKSVSLKEYHANPDNAEDIAAQRAKCSETMSTWESYVLRAKNFTKYPDDMVLAAKILSNVYKIRMTEVARMVGAPYPTVKDWCSLRAYQWVILFPFLKYTITGNYGEMVAYYEGN